MTLAVGLYSNGLGELLRADLVNRRAAHGAALEQHAEAGRQSDENDDKK